MTYRCKEHGERTEIEIVRVFGQAFCGAKLYEGASDKCPLEVFPLTVCCSRCGRTENGSALAGSICVGWWRDIAAICGGIYMRLSLPSLSNDNLVEEIDPEALTWLAHEIFEGQIPTQGPSLEQLHEF